MPDSINYLLRAAHTSYQHIRIVDEKALVIESRLWDK